MATQVTAYQQPQILSLEAIRQLLTISDNVSTNLSLGHILPEPVDTFVFPPGSHAFETLKASLESITKFQVDFELRIEHTGRTVLWPISKSMSSGSPASSVDTAVGLTADEQSISASTPSANDVASTHKKIPRPKNAFMIYRLQHHSKVAGANPGMHNNDISKKIGLQWRSEKPEVIEAFKRQAEEEKRQHAIAHPGYRYQPRKPSEKKKRMTKNKLAKLAAESGSSNTTMNVTNIPAQLDPSSHFYQASSAELFDFSSMPDFNFDMSEDLAGPLANTGMLPTASQAGTEQSADPTTTYQPVVEQNRQEDLDDLFDWGGYANSTVFENSFVAGGECGPVAADFDPSEFVYLHDDGC